MHGNPTWSYLWRRLVRAAPSSVRVIAIDQLDMGYSERTGTTRRLGQRIDDLHALTSALGLTGPVVTVAHDWGGPISLGWAQRNPDIVAGIVLANTAVEQPSDAPAPRFIRMVRAGGILNTACVRTPVFLRGTVALARPRMDSATRAAYEAPYRAPHRRRAIGAFVEDIPLSDTHPSRAALDAVIDGLESLREVPTLLLWGTSDPVFSDVHLRDLASRLPSASIHRFIGAGHLVPEDADVASAVLYWVSQLDRPRRQQAAGVERRPLWASLDRRSSDDDVALVEMGASGQEASISFAELASDVKSVAAGLASFGVERGSRVALLIPPGIDLAVCVYACWRMGAVVVVADAGLGARGMSRAMASADPAYLIGVPRAMVAASSMRWPGLRISTRTMGPARRRLLGVRTTLEDLRRRGEGAPAPDVPAADDMAAIGFTSGATGPAKGVAYRHHQLQAQRDALVDLYGIRPEDSLVAAFGPFSLFGPSMGIASVVPDMEVTAPGSLTGEALAKAVAAVGATLVFASPAALSNAASTGVPATMRASMELVRLVMSAGAPVGVSVLRSARSMMRGAEVHTPYGMTEVLPVADIELGEIEAIGPGNGVCVGRPVPGVEVAISEIDSLGIATGPLSSMSGVTGEVCIRAAHMREGYDNLWLTQYAASQPAGWHRSGDVGHLDEEGRLWIEGRMGHIISTASRPVTPVGVENAVAALAEVAEAAAVGVGPPGTQVLVVIVVPGIGRPRPGLADEGLADLVRSAVTGVDVSAVL
ncbi:MAG: alpha/beta fold hydrolase, partial [Acidimicrobiia bacterium]|nr:alpha/beta fold hydrolase [Acidimicrobiia bacterium]